MRRRLLVVAAMVVGLAMMTAPVASAAPPVRGSYTGPFGPSTMTGICPFDFTWTGTQSIRWTVVINADGTAVENDHYVQQDTFTNPANGTVLSGDPYTGNYHVTYDASGAPVSWYDNGGIESINLPDGSRIWVVGRDNVLGGDPADQALTPDFGHAGSLAAFCSALATP